MKHATLMLGEVSVPYTLHKRKGARNITLTVKKDGSLRITLPFFTPYKAGEMFIVRKKQWIEDTWIHAATRTLRNPEWGIPEHYKKYKDEAYKMLCKRVEMYNKHYGFRLTRVAVKNQKTRWGSCSSRGTLNFNYTLLFLPEYLRDYIVVHELCHLREMNHSRKFWACVEETMPNHRLYRRELRQNY